MSAKLPIVLASVFYAAIYAGCAHRPPLDAEVPGGDDAGTRSGVPGSQPAPEPGGRVRIRLSGEWTAAPRSARDDLGRFLVAATGQGVLTREPSGGIGPGVASEGEISSDSTSGSEWRFKIDPEAIWQDGTPVRAEDVVASWTVALRDEESPAPWLLAPVEGALAVARGDADVVDGLQADGDVLVVRLERPTPDLRERLAHPSLTVWKAGAEPALGGSGPFRPAPGGNALVSNPGRALLERVDAVSASTADVKLLARLGEVDVAVVYGRDASDFLEPREPSKVEPFAIERLEAWDRTYFLWLNPARRWTRDPTFRRWLSATVDRTAMMRYLFDGLGAWPCNLLSGCGGELSLPDDPGPRWRVPGGLRPRIVLTFEAGDRIASEIAARIKADLEGAGVGVDLDSRPRDALVRGQRSGSYQAVLTFQRSWTSDPVLTLVETLDSTGPATAEDRSTLTEAAREPPGSGRRLAAALEVQERILRDATIVPLARIDAWVVVAPGLVLDPGASPSLDIARAGWLP